MRPGRFLSPLVLALAACGSHGGRDAALDLPDSEWPVSRVTSGRAGKDRDPHVSADGTLLFYASSSFGQNLDLFVRTIGANTAIRLTSLEGDARFPKVSPASPQTLAFCSNERGPWEIYVMPDYLTDPRKMSIVSEPGGDSIHPSWSPDGRYLAYCTSDGADGDWTLKIKDMKTAQTHTLEGIDGLLPEWSPLNNRIVFQRMKRRDLWYSSLWTVEFEEGRSKNLTLLFDADDWAAINPSWSPDGKRIVFTTVAKSLARSGVLNEGDDLWTILEDGSRPTRLTSSPAADWMPVWSRDGKIYFISDRDQTQRVWCITPPPAK